MKTAKIHPFDIEQLACAIIGLDYDEIDANTEIIDRELVVNLNVDLQQFQRIVERLIPLIQVGQSPLTKKIYKGFAEDSVWLVKSEIE